MIQRYSRAEMREIWAEQRKLEIWLQIELLAADALCRNGLIPKKDLAQMKRRAAFSLERCKELERTLNHDVIAFTTNVAENIGAPASRWLHFGLTSSDILDTAFAVQMVQSADILLDDLRALRKAIGRKARQHRLTPMIGRSHGIHAEPTTFGLKMALMYDEFGRAIRRLESARYSVAVGKLSGAVGTSAHLAPKIESYVCAKLELRPAPIATQVVQRDIHAEFITTL
ncbi:MAG TPA: lyase family protein, partial [Candidatus Paceibacterota bacterium]|nr:lyase family protein [Candidatus Paceibacterota bacterium]